MAKVFQMHVQRHTYLEKLKKKKTWGHKALATTLAVGTLNFERKSQENSAPFCILCKVCAG